MLKETIVLKETPEADPSVREEADETVANRAAGIVIDPARDALLTDFGRATLLDRYLLKGESFQDMFARVAKAYADDDAHAQRLYDYISRLWFMPATPILSNGGAARGMPISCFINNVPDSLEGIVNIWNENVALASNGGGIGTYWGKVRSIGERVGRAGATSGIVPFIRVMDSMTLAISQGSLRRGSAAVYLDITHPEVEEFLELRKPTGDYNRRALNLHNALIISDAFMEAVRDDKPFDLLSPATGQPRRTINARYLWQKILEIRIQTGEPYLLFSDTANRAMNSYQRDLGLKITASNLCAEIMLHTGTDHKGKERTAICCLSSVNLVMYDQWKNDPRFIEDIMRFLDNILTVFINTAPDSMAQAKYAAGRERSVGLGVMGFHSALQAKNIPFESALAKAFNIQVFRHLREKADAASKLLALERGPNPDAQERGVMERFTNKLAVAPTSSISIICGGASAGIEPIPANIYTHKTLTGSFTVKNPYLRKRLMERGQDKESVWQSIIEHEGSIAHLPFLTDDEKDTFKTAFEINQRWLIELAADRTPWICQGQSLNLFLRADVNKWDLHMLHWKAWELGIKSLYYCRSKSIMRAQFAGGDRQALDQTIPSLFSDYEECLSCQ